MQATPQVVGRSIPQVPGGEDVAGHTISKNLLLLLSGSLNRVAVRPLQITTRVQDTFSTDTTGEVLRCHSMRYLLDAILFSGYHS